MLAEICEKLPGGNIDVVTRALGLDERIGRKYLTGSIGYGGPCFPRDNVALSFIAKELGVEASLAEVTDKANRSIPTKVAERLLPMVRKGGTVAVLGLSYKPFSHVTEESQGVYIAQHLSRHGLRVVAYDPMSSEMALEEIAVISSSWMILPSALTSRGRAYHNARSGIQSIVGGRFQERMVPGPRRRLLAYTSRKTRRREQYQIRRYRPRRQ